MFKKPELPPVDDVVLKPWHGIRPAYYILALNLLFVLVIFFLICLLPGIVTNKTYVSFDSPLPVYGVYEDGRYLGNGYGTSLETTGGKHTYTFTYEGIEIGSTTVDVPRHYFFTFFHNYVFKITPEFTYTDEVKCLAVKSFASGTALYSPITDYTEEVKYPSPYSKFASTAVEMKIDDVRDVWLYGALHITSGTMYDDYTEGKGILDKNGITYSSQELETVEKYLDSLYRDGNTNQITINDKTTEIKVSKEGSFYTYEKGRVTIGETTSPSYPESNKLPRTLDYASFSMSGSLVTENEYALFVEENPEWSKNNIENLIEEGKVDSNYLKGINLSSRSSRPIRYISWYAAEAYIEWKSEKDGVEYSLPTLYEWYVAALSSENKKYVSSLVFVENDSATPTSLMGQLWDMTSTVYMPLMRLVDEETISRLSLLFPFDDIIVMGGSYVNEDVTRNDVGIASKSKSSEFNGFRLVKHE